MYLKEHEPTDMLLFAYLYQLQDLSFTAISNAFSGKSPYKINAFRKGDKTQ